MAGQKESVKKDLALLMKTPVKATPSTPKTSAKPVWDSEEEGLDLANSAITNASQRLKRVPNGSWRTARPAPIRRGDRMGTAPPTPSQTTPAMTSTMARSRHSSPLKRDGP